MNANIFYSRQFALGAKGAMVAPLFGCPVLQDPCWLIDCSKGKNLAIRILQPEISTRGGWLEVSDDDEAAFPDESY